jgi:hypothetical protein
VSADVAIAGFLESEGYGGDPARARAVLEREKLTRPGKERISAEKLDRARAALKAEFFRTCAQPKCVSSADASGRAPFRTPLRERCESCGGSDNRKAEQELVAAFRAKGLRRLVIVGGSPAVRDELQEVVGSALELRMIDGTARRTADRARADLEWADLVLVWGGSELDHKVSLLYTAHLPPEQKAKVVTLAKRGVAALMDAALRHLEGGGR